MSNFNDELNKKFNERWREFIKEEQERAKQNNRFRTNGQFNWEYGGRGHGKTQATEDWIKAHTGTFKMPDLEAEYEKAKAWAKMGEPSTCTMIPVPELDLYNMSKGIKGKWTAPHGWNHYLTTGNFIGCMPIIKPGAKFNTRASFIDPIKFEMV
jgi:hypothetical protein